MVWRKVLVGAAFGLGALVLAAPAHATVALVDGTIPLKGAHTNKTAQQFLDAENKAEDCSGPFANLGVDKDGWHFVLPDSSGDDFVSVTLMFSNGGPSFPVVIDAVSPATDSGSGWMGWIDDAGNSGSFKHLYVITDAGWTLVSGLADVNGPPAPELGDEFNLSHTCVGGTTTTTSPPTTTTLTTTKTTTTTTTTTSTRTTSTTTSGTMSTTAGTTPPRHDGELPVTGTALGGVILTGIALAAGGTLLVLARRRRDAVAASVDAPPLDTE